MVSFLLTTLIQIQTKKKKKKLILNLAQIHSLQK